MLRWERHGSEAGERGVAVIYLDGDVCALGLTGFLDSTLTRA